MEQFRYVVGVKGDLTGIEIINRLMEKVLASGVEKLTLTAVYPWDEVEQEAHPTYYLGEDIISLLGTLCPLSYSECTLPKYIQEVIDDSAMETYALSFGCSSSTIVGRFITIPADWQDVGKKDIVKMWNVF